MVTGSATLEQLEADPYPLLAALREEAPVAWVPPLEGWLVTSRRLCVEVMRDPVTFTVDDPRFSTAQVVGPSMLSLDGPEHARHREPFAGAFAAAPVKEGLADPVGRIASELVEALWPRGRAELRRELAGPLAVEVMALALGLPDTDPATLLGWYDAIVTAVNRISAGEEAGPEGAAAYRRLAERVSSTVGEGRGLLAEAAATLSPAETTSNAAVMLFGGIETAEGMTANAFWHLLTHPDQLAEVTADPSLIPAAVEESLRLEPAASRVDRYATRDVRLGTAAIKSGDLVIVSLTAANRDPEFFPDPDRYDLRRPNARQHLTFAQGPHACLGIHLARLETSAALEAALAKLPGLALESSQPPTGLVFRKPPTVFATWDHPG
jgi:cytochrome P450